ncbi:MAG: GNAT family N-acetyltransferase [Fibrobacteria bacterium]|nr:GNAT family N-acetyltransferase [Fibrobacteria bacterium]
MGPFTPGGSPGGTEPNGRAGVPVELRQALPDDVRALLALHAQIGQDDGTVLGETEARTVLERIASYPDYQIRVAEFEGRIVGTYALLIMDNLAHRGAPSAIVEDVVVDGKCRGRGIGRAMMVEAMDLARRRGCYKIVLNSNRHRAEAHRFYEGLGFERHGISFFMSLED